MCIWCPCRYSPELNPTEAIGDVVKDRIGNVLWDTIADLEQSIGEELRPLCENPERVRRLVSQPWLVEQTNATETENSAITCSKGYDIYICAAVCPAARKKILKAVIHPWMVDHTLPTSYSNWINGQPGAIGLVNPPIGLTDILPNVVAFGPVSSQMHSAGGRSHQATGST